MERQSLHRMRVWMDGRSAALLLVVTALGLAGGGIAALAGAGAARDGVWLAAAAAGLGYALWPRPPVSAGIRRYPPGPDRG
jgi:hypothetical protein